MAEKAVRIIHDSVKEVLGDNPCSNKTEIPVNSTTPWDQTKDSATWRNGVI
jgi:hypothetical protein